MLAAHNVAFDVPVLRAELARVGEAPLVDVAVLDTRGAIRGLAGLGVGPVSLDALLEVLGIPVAERHSALGDASATALAAIEMLRRAETLGHTDLAALLTAPSAERSGSVRWRPIQEDRPAGDGPR